MARKFDILKEFETIKLRFGKYKNKPIKNVPDSYIKWMIENSVAKGKLLIYCKTKLDYPKDTFKITVEDAVSGDGVYFVDAYTNDDAIQKCKVINKIQVTQSYHGTSFTAEKIIN